MKRSTPIVRLVTLLAAALLSLPTMAEEDHRRLTVSGSATVNAAPDRAMITMGIQDRNPSMSAARDKVAKVAGNFLALCKKLGIEDKHIQTTGLSINPEYRWEQNTREQRFVGYFVQRQLVVEVQDLDLLGKLIEGAVDSGVNQVSPPTLNSSRRKALQREALAEAAKDARASAKVLADTMGIKLGAVRQLDAVENYGGPVPMRGRAMAMEADGGAADTYQAGDISFNARVNVVFDLEE